MHHIICLFSLWKKGKGGNQIKSGNDNEHGMFVFEQKKKKISVKVGISIFEWKRLECLGTTAAVLLLMRMAAASYDDMHVPVCHGMKDGSLQVGIERKNHVQLSSKHGIDLKLRQDSSSFSYPNHTPLHTYFPKRQSHNYINECKYHERIVMTIISNISRAI